MEWRHWRWNAKQDKRRTKKTKKLTLQILHVEAKGAHSVKSRCAQWKVDGVVRSGSGIEVGLESLVFRQQEQMMKTNVGDRFKLSTKPVCHANVPNAELAGGKA